MNETIKDIAAREKHAESPVSGQWEYALTIRVGHDAYGRPVLQCASWPPTPAEAGVVRQMRDMLSSWIENN